MRTGLDKTTVDHIAADAGLSRTSFFRYPGALNAAMDVWTVTGGAVAPPVRLDEAMSA